MFLEQDACQPWRRQSRHFSGNGEPEGLQTKWNKAGKNKCHMTSLPCWMLKGEVRVQAWDRSGCLQGLEGVGRWWPEAVRHHSCRMSRLWRLFGNDDDCGWMFWNRRGYAGTPSKSKGRVERKLVSEGLAGHVYAGFFTMSVPIFISFPSWETSILLVTCFASRSWRRLKRF